MMIQWLAGGRSVVFGWLAAFETPPTRRALWSYRAIEDVERNVYSL